MDLKINQDNLKLYYYYMKERNSIYYKKEILGQKYPWTDDQILRDNSFTCVKRWQDKTSRWLISHITESSRLNLSGKIWRTIVFRLYNRIETAELIEIDSQNFWLRIPEMMSRLDNYPNDPFTRAYKVIKPKYAYRDISPNGHDNWKSSLLWHISNLRDSYKSLIPEEITSSPESAIKWLEDNIIGVGDFIAYQIWCDFCYIKEYPHETNDFAIAGPGCCAGIDMLVDDLGGLSHNDFLFWLRDNINDLFKSVDPEYDVDKFFGYLKEEYRYWDLQDIENSFCEFSKYIYLKEGRHKKPRKYIPNLSR